jgi:N-methylhydantoinase B
VDLAFTVDGSPELTGASIGGHGHVPMPGTAGGAPGRGASIELHDRDGEATPIGTLTQGFRLPEGHSYVVYAAGGGGWGDPLDRDAAAVLDDVATGLISAGQAREVYGVDASDGTTSRRTEILRARLASARPAAARPGAVAAEASAPKLPLAPGVEQRGGVAVSARSGAILAHAPAHWTDGCPVLVQEVAEGVETRSYLDPATGHILHAEVAIAGEPRSFESSPKRWTAWTG